MDAASYDIVNLFLFKSCKTSVANFSDHNQQVINNESQDSLETVIKAKKSKRKNQWPMSCI